MTKRKLGTIVFALFSVAVAVSTHLCVLCRHFCCPLSLFQGHFASVSKFSLTAPEERSQNRCNQRRGTLGWGYTKHHSLYRPDGLKGLKMKQARGGTPHMKGVGTLLGNFELNP